MPQLELPEPTLGCDEVIDRLRPCDKQIHVRRYERYTCELAITLIGLDANLNECSEPVAVRSRNVSGDCIAIEHTAPIPFRFVALEFADEPLDRVGDETTETAHYVGLRFVAKLAWCRYLGNGSYLSGGRFLSLTPTSLS